MTMPHLENCPHKEEGWCGDCVKKMGTQLCDLRLLLVEISNLTVEEVYDEGCESPSRIQAKPEEFEQWKTAMRHVNEICRKYLI